MNRCLLSKLKEVASIGLTYAPSAVNSIDAYVLGLRRDRQLV